MSTNLVKREFDDYGWSFWWSIDHLDDLDDNIEDHYADDKDYYWKYDYDLQNDQHEHKHGDESSWWFLYGLMVVLIIDDVDDH